MEQAQPVDLIDDIWRKIFTSFDCRLRARLFQVCKRWNSIIANPLCWIELDVSFPEKAEAEMTTKITSFNRFVAKYCTLASKVNIELPRWSNWRTVLESLFPLSQLRFLRFTLGRLLGEDSITPTTFNSIPNWPNMVYLNFGSVTNVFVPSVFESIFAGSPNLEELYLHRSTPMRDERFTTVFRPLRKLKYLSLPENALVQDPLFVLFGAETTADINPREIVAQMPELDTLLLYRPPQAGGFGAPAPQRLICEHHGGTLIVTSSFLMSRELSVVKLLGPLLKKSNYALYFVSPSEGNTKTKYDPELLHYLFKELKLDINCNASDTSNPFVADLIVSNRPLSPSCPLSSVLADVDEVRQMLDFGADPNMAHPDMSPFASPDVTKESCLLLLERGADPLKKVKGKAAMAHLFSSPNLSDEDIVDIFNAILSNGISANYVVNNGSSNGSGELDDEKTLLDLAIQHKYREAARVLLHNGANWTASAIDHLLTWDSQWLTKVIESGSFELSKLKLLSALKAINHNLYPLVRPYLQNFAKDLDLKGYSLVHYITALSLMNWLSPSIFDKLPLEQIIKEVKLDVNLKSAMGETPLLLVCENQLDDADPATVLINSGANVNEPDVNGWTPLHAALYLRKYKTAKLLLSRGANINAQDTFGITPMMAFVWLAATDDLPMAMWKHLLSRGPDVTLTDKYMSRSLLHHLSMSPLRNCLAFLLETVPGIDVNCRDAQGFTPLHYAAIYNDIETMELLIKHGADTNAVSYTLKLTPFAAMLSVNSLGSPYYRYLTSYSTQHQTRTTVSSVMLEGQFEILRICKPGRTSKANTKGTLGGLRGFYPFPTDLSIKDQFGNTCLHDIVRHPELITTTYSSLPSGVDELWSVPNKSGMTPVHIFAKYTYWSPLYKPKDAEEDLLVILKKHRSRLLFGLTHKDEFGKTGMEYFFTYKAHRQPLSPAVKEALYQIGGVKFSSPITEKVSSFLHNTIKNNAIDNTLLTRVFESNPDSLNMKVNGKTPLIFLTEKWLMQHNMNFRNFPSALEIFNACFALKVDLNAQDNHGNTALHYACYFLHLGGWDQQQVHNAHVFSFILFKLLEAGARVDVKNNEGQTATDIIPNLLELDRSLLHRVDMHPPPIENLKVERPTRPIDLFM